MTKKRTEQYSPVRVECPSCACGYVGHMTADELKERAAHDDVELACPVCGLIHLSREEIDEQVQHRVVDSQRYRTIQQQAQANS
ncbi:hypothetical protein [Desulfogranum mediterraneum]|uniref:hypothetical protein n=1 Tax=Desulfogranum mediterraneum TaxID=160661 RepID=UPI00040AADAD|nr:hypothetical protein [Desulfogranum mediterraneum]